MPSFFERFFGRKPGPPPPQELVPDAGGLLPAQAPEDLFDILLTPPEGPQGPSLPILREETPVGLPDPIFDILEAPELPARLPEAFPMVPRRAETPYSPPVTPLFDIEAEREEVIERERERRRVASYGALSRILDLDWLLRTIEKGRRDPDFGRDVERTLQGGRPAEIPLLMIAPREQGAEEKVADFLGIPRSELRNAERRGVDPWPALLSPALYEVERALEWFLGDRVPGVFHFDVNDEGQFGLVYLEDHPDL